MILKIIALVFGYLLCGVGVLELVRLHDRHTDWIDKWMDDDDEIEQVMVVLLFPVALLFLILFVIRKIVFWFIKTVQTVFTTLIYTIVALVKEKDNDTRRDR